MKGRTTKTAQQKVLGYIRVSSVEQVNDGESLERQEEQIRAYCALKGLKEVQIIADKGISGFKTSRPGFQKIIQLCLSGEVKMVIVADLSRLSRKVRDTITFVEDVIHKQGIEFVSIRETIDTTTPMGTAFLTFNAAFNQLYRDEISFRTKAALKHKRSKGEKTGGVVPFGYKLVGESRLAASADEVGTISLIHQLRKKGLSLRDIVGALHSKGISTKTGKQQWNPKVIKQILDRQINQITFDIKLKDSEKDELLEDVAGAIYDTDTLSKKKKPRKLKLVNQETA